MTAAGETDASPADGRPPPEPLVLARSHRYLVLLVFAAMLGVPVAALAFGYLEAVEHVQPEVFTHLPHGLGFHSTPTWWPIPVLVVAGLLVALIIRHLPGDGGHEPLGELSLSHVPTGRELPGIALAALISLSLGAVLGPEAPLIGLGGGAAALALRRLRPDAGGRTVSMVAAAGSFAAISTLFGSPLLAAFLLMEASGLASPLLGVVMLPGMLAARPPTIAEFFWAVAIGAGAAVLAGVVTRLAHLMRAQIARRRMLLTLAAGLLIAVAAVGYAEASGKPQSDVLFSGEFGIAALIEHHAEYTVATLLLLVVCKAFAYTASLSAFRGGLVFPALFLGVAGGTAMAHLPGLTLVPAIATGMGAMCVAVLGLPLSSVLLATLLLGGNGLTVMPLVIVAVAVSRTLSLRLVVE